MDDRGGERHVGTFAGVPYDWRRPTLARVRARWWNPRERRLLTPKAFGWGYAVNLYEVGRRLAAVGRCLRWLLRP